MKGVAAQVEQAGQRRFPTLTKPNSRSVIRALGDMKQPLNTVRWERSGTRGMGVLVSDTMMFQRGDPTPSDPHLGSFYGLAMPLLKRGVPVEPVQIESALKPGFLKSYRVLLLTYEGQKPPTPEFHRALTSWVQSGGALVVMDDDKDPYNAVRDWWNTAPNAYKTPRQHLFQTLGPNASGTFASAKVWCGVLFAGGSEPSGGRRPARAASRDTSRFDNRVRWQKTNALVLRRGPYVVGASLDESPNAAPTVLRGRFVDCSMPSCRCARSRVDRPASACCW